MDLDAGIPRSIREATPWATYVSFQDMLDGNPVSMVKGEPARIVTRDNLRDLLNYNFSRHSGASSTCSGRRWPTPSPTAARITTRRTGRRASAWLWRWRCARTSRATIADTVATQVAALIAYDVQTKRNLKLQEPVPDGDGIALEADKLLGQDFNTRIGLGLILRALETKAATNLAHYTAMRELKLCLEVALPDVSGWQTKKARAQPA